MITINFSQYCKKIYPYCHQISSQGLFVSKLFIAGGSSYFSASINAYKEYQKKLFNGSKPLTQNLKNSFPANIQLDALIDLFEKHLKDDLVRKAMTEFGIPVSLAPEKNTFSRALALQFCHLIEKEDNDVDDIVAVSYQRLLLEPQTQPTKRLSPLYPGDSAWVDINTKRSYSLCCYDKIPHTWTILNNGTQTWRGRKLVFVNHDEVRPKAESNYIEIPDTPPDKEIKITTAFDARGFEGKYDCIWQMHDSSGNNCFPNNEKLFCVSFDIKFQSK